MIEEGACGPQAVKAKPCGRKTAGRVVRRKKGPAWRRGWTRRGFPAFCDDDGFISVSGLAKGPFGVFVREFIDHDAGRTCAASLSLGKRGIDHAAQ